MVSNIEVKMIWCKSVVQTNQNEEGRNVIKQNGNIYRKNKGGHENQSSPRMKYGSIGTRTAIKYKKRIQDWIVMAILAYYIIGHTVLDTRSAC